MKARVGLLALLAASCSNVVGAEGPPPPSPPPPKTTAAKLDILLVVDDSSSMSGKQALLAEALPVLLSRLANPPCVATDGTIASQPAQPSDACPAGTRASQPLTSIHLGVITSSLGGLGSDACQPQPGHVYDARAHLVVRTPSSQDPTYLGSGFLAYDPNSELAPPGQTSLATFVHDATDLVVGVGERGCGYQMPLEAAYRFLIDPAPYDSLVKADMPTLAPTTKMGIDAELLDERARFLRPDSVLAVVVLTDENDCSVRAGGQAYAPLESTPFYEGSASCASDAQEFMPINKKPALATDPCCYSCGLGAPPGCTTPDPVCSTTERYTAQQDNPSLKCFHQKERYGFDGLYPVARYINAFSHMGIAVDSDDLDSGAHIVNPLFAGGRPPAGVIVTAVVGVPWQEIANDASDPTRGTQSPQSLVDTGAWDLIVGDPDVYRYPLVPTMIESVAKRAGVNPAENGGDRSLDTSAPVDLQYACTFKLSVPAASTDCTMPDAPDNPICQGPLQIAGKAYPGLRELAVIRGLGDQGLVASICPFNAVDVTKPTFGFGPAMNATAARIARLFPSE